MNKLAIIGAGHLGQQMLHYAKLNGTNVIGFFDDTIPRGKVQFGIPVLGALDEIYDLFTKKIFTHVIFALGYNHLEFKRDLIIKMDALKIPLASIICKGVYVDPSADIENGVFIMPGSVIDQRVVLKKGSILNCNVTVSHDSILENCTFVAPAVTISGFVNVGYNTFLGANSTISDNVSIVGNVKIGSGAVVLNDITEQGTYVGVPARKKM